MRFVFVHKVVSVLFLFLRVRVRISDGNDGHQPCYGSDCDGDATIDSDSVSEVLLMVTLITPRHKHDAH